VLAYCNTVITFNEFSVSWREEEKLDFENPLHVLSHTTNYYLGRKYEKMIC